jgi:hypothetical protein
MREREAGNGKMVSLACEALIFRFILITLYWAVSLLSLAFLIRSPSQSVAKATSCWAASVSLLPKPHLLGLIFISARAPTHKDFRSNLDREQVARTRTPRQATFLYRSSQIACKVGLLLSGWVRGMCVCVCVCVWVGAWVRACVLRGGSWIVCVFLCEYVEGDVFTGCSGGFVLTYDLWSTLLADA